jgi:hypothetical protein
LFDPARKEPSEYSIPEESPDPEEYPAEEEYPDPEYPSREENPVPAEYPAPEGRPTLAQRFSAGKDGKNDSSPRGTTEFSLTLFSP